MYQLTVFQEEDVPRKDMFQEDRASDSKIYFSQHFVCGMEISMTGVQSIFWLI